MEGISGFALALGFSALDRFPLRFELSDFIVLVLHRPPFREFRRRDKATSTDRAHAIANIGCPGRDKTTHLIASFSLAKTRILATICPVELKGRKLGILVSA